MQRHLIHGAKAMKQQQKINYKHKQIISITLVLDRNESCNQLTAQCLSVISNKRGLPGTTF